MWRVSWKRSVFFRGEHLWLTFPHLFPLCSPGPIRKGDTDTHIPSTDACAVLIEH